MTALDDDSRLRHMGWALVVVTVVLFFIALAIPFYGIFAVTTAVAYLASDIAIKYAVDAGPGWLKVLGTRYFRPRAYGFYALIGFVLVVSPLIAYGVQAVTTRVVAASPIQPLWLGQLSLAGLLAVVASSVVYLDLLRMISRS